MSPCQADCGGVVIRGAHPGSCMIQSGNLSSLWHLASGAGTVLGSGGTHGLAPTQELSGRAWHRDEGPSSSQVPAASASAPVLAQVARQASRTRGPAAAATHLWGPGLKCPLRRAGWGRGSRGQGGRQVDGPGVRVQACGVPGVQVRRCARHVHVSGAPPGTGRGPPGPLTELTPGSASSARSPEACSVRVRSTCRYTRGAAFLMPIYVGTLCEILHIYT